MQRLKDTFKIFSALVWAVGLGSCAAKTVTFTSSQDLTLTVQKLGEFEDKGEPLKLTEAVPAEKLQGKMVRFSMVGKQIQYVAFTSADSGQTSIHLDLPDQVAAPAAATAPTINKNALARLIIQATQAIETKEFGTANELAGKLEKLDATLSAPHILRGLVLFEQGKRNEAIAQFKQAKALDPEDTEIDQLIRSTQ